jgi:hypothetical protein
MRQSPKDQGGGHASATVAVGPFFLLRCPWVVLVPIHNTRIPWHGTWHVLGWMFHVWVGPSTPTVHLPCASSCTPGLSATSRVTTYSSSQSLRASMVVLLALIACLFLFPVSFTHRTLSNRRTAGGGGRDYNENNTSLLPEPPQQPTGNSQGDNVNRSDFERPSPDHSLLPEPPPPQARTTPRAPTPKTKKKNKAQPHILGCPLGLRILRSIWFYNILYLACYHYWLSHNKCAQWHGHLTGHVSLSRKKLEFSSYLKEKIKCYWIKMEEKKRAKDLWY